MARIYSIHLVLPFSITGKRIPNHALTHYTFTIYPTKDTTPKTKKGFARKPMAKRKSIKDTRPLPIAPQAAKPVATPKPKKQRSKFRKNINKPALAAYFGQAQQITRAAAIQQWQNAVVAELEAADKIKAQNAVTAREELRKFVESVRAPKNVSIDMLRQESTSPFGIYDEYDIDSDYDLYFGEFDDSELIYPQNNQAKQTEEDDDFYLFTDTANNYTEENQYPHRSSLSIESKDKERAEINESIVDRFIGKYQGADTNAAMRAFEKQKFHSTRLQYILHQLQITK